VSAELTDELHFLKALALVGMFFQPKAGLRVLTLLRKEKSCYQKASANFIFFATFF
jgi:hypothetical protein